MAISLIQSTQVNNGTRQASLTCPAITVTAGSLLLIYINGPAVGDGDISFTGVAPVQVAAAGRSSGALTFTTALASGATSGTLSAAWANTTGSYAVSFSNGNWRLVTLTHSATTATWSCPLSASATTAADVYTDQGLSVYAVVNAAGGSTTVEVSDASTNLCGVYVEEWGGVSTTAPILGAGAGYIASPGTGAGAIFTSAFNTSSTPATLTALGLDWGRDDASTDLTAGTGYTIRTAVWSSAAGFGWPEYNTSPSGNTSLNATWTADSDAQYNQYMSVVVALAAGSTGAAGTAAVAEGADVVSAAGALATSGAGTPTEAHDAISGAGTLSTSGSAAISEPHDVASGAGSLSTTGSAAAVEPHDVVSGAGSLSTSGSGAVAEPHDTVSGSGAPGASGAGAAAESADVAAGTGHVSTSGTAAVVENPDTADASGALSTTGSGAVAEGHDTVAGSGSGEIADSGSAQITEAPDGASGTGQLATSGTGNATEGNDSVAGRGGTNAIPRGAERLLVLPYRKRIRVTYQLRRSR